ncbi:MAG: shikimate dehydrogenase family protein [Bradymonadia bacterium]
MIKLGIVGTPVEHSLSPSVHQFIASQLGLTVQYDRFETVESDLVERLNWLGENGYRGINVTAPLKIAAAQLVAQETRPKHPLVSVNTICFEDGKIQLGENTDALGFEHLLGDVSPRRVAILGAGGVLSTIVSVLESRGVQHVSVFNRSAPRCSSVQDKIKQGADYLLAPISEFEQMSGTYDHVIQCLPRSAARVIDAIRLHRVPEECRIVDLNYGEITYGIKRESEQCGLTYVNGLSMLAVQAIKSFELWTGERAPTALLSALIAHIERINRA